MDGEAATFNSHQRNDHQSDIIVLLLDNDSTCSGFVAKMLKTRIYEVSHFHNLNDAFGAVRDGDETLKLIFTTICFPDSKGCVSFSRGGVMPVVCFPEKDREILFQALGGGVTVYHVKNVNLDDIEDIWHHIFMYKQHKKSATDTNDNADENSLHAAPPAPADSTSTSAVRDSDPGRVRGSSRGAAGLAKKDRVVWTIELNNRFIEAYNLLGHQGATPCRILELMNDPRLTRFHIASHLQKYRTHLREMQEEELNPRRSKFRYNCNDPNICSGSHNGSVVRSVALRSHHQPPVNTAESFTKFLSEMEDEELFALAQSQNQRIPSLSPSSSRFTLGQDDIGSPDLDLAHILESDEFKNIFSMLHNCVSGDTFSNSYVGLKISNEGELLLWDNAAAGQVAGQVTHHAPPSAAQFLNLEPINFSSTDVTGSPREFSPSGVNCIDIDSPVTFDTEISCLYVGEVLDHLDSNIQ